MKRENINRGEKMGLKVSQPTIPFVFPFFPCKCHFPPKEFQSQKLFVSWTGVFKDEAFVQPGSWDFLLDPVEKMVNEETIMVSCDGCIVFIFLQYTCCKYSLLCFMEEKVKGKAFLRNIK